MNLNEYVGKIINGDVIDYTHLGLGVIKHEDVPIFVFGAKIGQNLDIKITANKKSFLMGEVANSNDYIKDSIICDNYFECGGCDIMHMKYEEQISFKKNAVINTLRKQKVDIKDIMVIENNDYNNGYRNKSRYFIEKVNDKYIKSLYGRNKKLSPIKYCHLQSKLCNDIVDEVIKNFDYVNKPNNIKQIEIIESKSTNDIIVTLICENQIKISEPFIDALIKDFENIKIINIKVKDVLQNKYLKSEVFEVINGIKYVIESDSFFQVNTKQAAKMMDEVVNATDYGNKKVLDAYSGSGFFSLALAKKAREVIAVELNKKAIEIANVNKVNNEINNVTFVNGDIEKEIIKYSNKNDFFDIVVVDPPRKGLLPNFINMIFEYKPAEIVYVSCNPATLARDLNTLSELYEIEKMTAIDMFSHTHHIEIITKLKLKS